MRALALVVLLTACSTSPAVVDGGGDAFSEDTNDLDAWAEGRSCNYCIATGCAVNDSGPPVLRCADQPESTSPGFCADNCTPACRFAGEAITCTSAGPGCNGVARDVTCVPN